jgi:serine/threonine protein kinase
VSDTLNLYNSDEYLGKVLVQKGVISDAQYQETLKLMGTSGSASGGLGKLLVKQGYIASEEVLQTIQIGASQSAPGPASATLNVPGMSTPMPIEVAQAARNEKMVFGKYVLVKKLGEGGFAFVFRAWDTFLRQFVAIKVLKKQEGGGGPEDSATQQDIADFLKEARTSVRLRHPNFVHVYEVGSIEAKYYLSMELVDGPTFYELIHGTRERNTDTYFPSQQERFLTIMRDVAMAVHYAHSQNPPLVHRDLKPQNILVDKDGKPFVADLGLAKEVRLERSETVTGVVKGTPWYMAPEQAAGNSKDIDARTDVWQLGAILYEVLTGRVPFVRDSVQALLNAICNDEPLRPNQMIAKSLGEQPAGTHRPKPVAKELETICLKALEKKKYHRYETAKAFAEDIDRFLHSQRIVAEEPSLKRRIARKVRAHPLLAGSLAALLLAAGAAAGVYYAKPGVDPAAPVLERAAASKSRKDWKAYRAALVDLRGVAPNHPELGGHEKAVADHDAEHGKLKGRWDEALGRLRTDLEGLPDLEAAYGGCSD